ncbi:hypothetical protein ANCDUO_13785 [Ancylostoma duodenale]|uniref:Mos1 transposase HTH domain-containing protein n=1 Tax=Ancylostoma duodenale TaxID=51022 RepID=A0A0C2D1X2_9BILA|nr:hypothetical protein ANCDUO_13785 [Ancylostoma duodenale]
MARCGPTNIHSAEKSNKHLELHHELLKRGQTFGRRFVERANDSFGQRSEYETRQHKVILLHNNAPPRITKAVKETLEALRWDVLPQAAYSPGHAPSDYKLFRSMSHGLSKQRFQSFECR